MSIFQHLSFISHRKSLLKQVVSAAVLNHHITIIITIITIIIVVIITIIIIRISGSTFTFDFMQELASLKWVNNHLQITSNEDITNLTLLSLVIKKSCEVYTCK